MTGVIRLLEAAEPRALPAAPSAPTPIRPAAAADRAAGYDEGLYLIGRPKVKHFLRYMHRHALDPDRDDVLIAEWQAARDRILVLEKEEAGCADHPTIEPIPVQSAFEPLLIEFLKDPLVRQGFNTVPSELAWIDLDRLVVYQKHIDMTYARQLRGRIGPKPTDEELFRICLPYEHPHPPASWSRIDDDKFVFVSPSCDMRFLGALPLEARHIRDYPHPGALLGVIGLAVGFGSNFLNAVHAENRLILNNGSHRAYALRELGITHVPCIVQHVSTRAELEAVAPSDVRRDPDLFLRNPRPPMLRDYLDPALRKVTAMRRVQRQVRVQFSISEHYVPAL